MILLYNAKIHTLDKDLPVASSLVIDNDRIVAVGGNEYSTSSEYQHWLDKVQEKINLEGRSVIPGLIDAHMHFKTYALGLQKIDCETITRQECLRRVKEKADKVQPGEWIYGHGWNQNSWQEGYGYAADLDAVAPVNPVYLTAKSLHAGWANSLALAEAGLNDQTPDPKDGCLGRDLEGKLNGLVFESAMVLIENKLPQPSIDDISQAMKQAQTELWRMGLTGLHDFDETDSFEALQVLNNSGELKLRVVKSIPLRLLSQAIDLGLRSGFGNEYLKIGQVKAFADGALGPHTAAMFRAYEDDLKNLGMLKLNVEEVYENGVLAARAGLPMAIHAIGDRAVNEVLNGLERLREFEKSQNITGLRHRIEHVQLIDPKDSTRLAELGIIASMQPYHMISDIRMADSFWGKRSKYAFAWQIQQKAGAVLAFGSDAPVEAPNPFWGLYAAVTRKCFDGYPGPDGWYPEQRLELMDALKAYTYGAAYAGGMENRVGKLAPGYFADLLVLDKDIFDCEAKEIKDMLPRATMVRGEWVWEE
ncbi:MAG: amidohydrolase [Anaerolineales bacterium]|nr:amidohydrolase [Anaerolineales bacterium]